MTDADVAEARQEPLLKRIVDFPLVAMVIALVIVTLCFTAGLLLGKYIVPPVPGFTPNMMFDLLSIAFLIPGYELVIRRLGRRPRDDYRDRLALRRLGVGVGVGFALFSLAVAVAAALGVYRIIGMGDLSDLFPALLATAIFPAISEELVFRGILFRWLEEFGGSWLALILTSALFGAAHLLNPHASLVAAVGIASEAGVMLGAAYMLTRSLWLPMGLHAAWNFTQGEIYDIPVSGSQVHGLLDARLTGDPLLTGNGFGLEASVIAMAVATAFGLWLLWLAIRKGEARPHWWARRPPGDAAFEIFA